MAVKVIPGGEGANGAAPGVVAELLVPFDTMTEKRGYVRFDSYRTDVPVKSFYLRRDGWEALGSPPLIEVSIRSFRP